MRFLVDAQLPPALARRLVQLGHEAEHVADCGLALASDSLIRAHAVRTGAAIVTKDEDFVVMRLLAESPPVLWMRTGNTRRAELLRRIEAALPEAVAAFERGETLVEII